jgi:trans-aconitate methyltransferase
MKTETHFDQYAEQYDAALKQGISLSGEDKDFFASERVKWLAMHLRKHGQDRIKRVMDYGCGIGSATPHLFEAFPDIELAGVDPSRKSIAQALIKYGTEKARFLHIEEILPQGRFDLVFCTGVFHHIPPAERAQALNYIFRALRPGGWFAFWENNPWNPLMCYAMHKCPFDDDAIKVSPPTARRLVASAGFNIAHTTFRFVFPHILRRLRWSESHLSRLPLGAQYQVLARKP